MANAVQKSVQSRVEENVSRWEEQRGCLSKNGQTQTERWVIVVNLTRINQIAKSPRSSLLFTIYIWQTLGFIINSFGKFNFREIKKTKSGISIFRK